MLWRRIAACLLSTTLTMSYPSPHPTSVRLFLSGDVMLGRGVDQILPSHTDPTLYEDYVKDARDYVKLAVNRNGPLPPNRAVNYVWGDAIDILDKMHPDLRIINLETAVTAGGRPWPHKGINYRMHPDNVNVIQSAKIDCCVLSNNHVLDWDYPGLSHSLEAIQKAGIKTVGAGENATEAQMPAVFPIPGSSGRVLIFGIGSSSSGVPASWRAGDKKPGLFYLDSFSTKNAKEIAKVIQSHKREGDIVILSIHWGSNWGWDLDPGCLDFAKELINLGIHLIHGHSSHHIRPVLKHKDQLIATGCGDLLSDYEGIGNPAHDSYRDDLSLMYFVDLDKKTSKLQDLYLVPMRLKQMKLNKAEGNDEQWLFENMKAQCRKYGGDIVREGGVFRMV